MPLDRLPVARSRTGEEMQVERGEIPKSFYRGHGTECPSENGRTSIYKMAFLLISEPLNWF